MIRGIKFVGVPVTDQDKALKFWTESIGMIVATDQPFNEKQRWIELKIPGQSMRDPGDRRDLNGRNEAEDRKILASIAILAVNRGRRIAPAQRVRPPSPRPPHSRH